MPALRSRSRWVIPVLALCCLAPVSGTCQTASGGAGAPVLTLNDAVKTALANSPQLRSAAQEVTKAGDAVAVARADRLPVVSVKADAGTLLEPLDVRIPVGSLGTVGRSPFPTGDASIYSVHGGVGLVGVTIAQPLTQLPGIRLNIRLQQLGVQVAQEQQRGSRQAVVAEVKQGYYHLLELQDGVAGAEQRLEYDQEIQRTVADFVAHETALQADLLDAQAQTAQQALTLAALRDQIADAKEQLNVLMGTEVTTPFDVALPAEQAASEDDLAMLRACALSRRADLRTADLHVAQAALGQRLAHQPNLPAISLALSIHQLAGSIDGLPDSLAFFGLQLDWQPLDWGRRRALQDQSDVQSAQAEEALRQTRSQILQEVDSKARQQAEAAQRLSVAQAGYRAAQERLREMTNQYKDKAILLKDLRRQQALVSDADGQQQQALVQLMAARTDLETTVGDDP
jgi:outer membrane protein TolC